MTFIKDRTMDTKLNVEDRDRTLPPSVLGVNGKTFELPLPTGDRTPGPLAPLASLETCLNEIWDRIIGYSVREYGIQDDVTKQLRPSAVAALFPKMRQSRTLARRMETTLLKSIEDFSATPSGAVASKEVADELNNISEIKVYMTIQSLLNLKAVAKNAHFAPLIKTMKLVSYDFSIKLSKETGFKKHLRGRWLHTGEHGYHRRKEERKIGARGVEKKLQYEYGYYRRYLAEALQIVNNGMFDRIMTETLSKFSALDAIHFTRHRCWGKVPDEADMVIEKPSKITVPKKAVKAWHIAATKEPIYWDPLLKLLVAASQHDRIDTLIISNAVPDYSLVPKAKRDAAGAFFSNLKHISVSCLRDSSSNPDRAEPRDLGKPRSRDAIGKNGAAVEAAAWQSILASSTKLESFQLALGDPSFGRGGWQTTTSTSILVNLILTSAAPSKLSHLQLKILDLNDEIFERFLLNSCQHVMIACFENIDFPFAWRYNLPNAIAPSLHQLPRLEAAVDRHKHDWPSFEPINECFGPQAAQLEAKGFVRIGRTVVRFDDPVGGSTKTQPEKEYELRGWH